MNSRLERSRQLVNYIMQVKNLPWLKQRFKKYEKIVKRHVWRTDWEAPMFWKNRIKELTKKQLKKKKRAENFSKLKTRILILKVYIKCHARCIINTSLLNTMHWDWMALRIRTKTLNQWQHRHSGRGKSKCKDPRMITRFAWPTSYLFLICGDRSPGTRMKCPETFMT